MRFELYKDGNGQWRWRLKAANGEIVASGESYVRRDDCCKAVGLIMDTTRSTPFHEVK